MRRAFIIGLIAGLTILAGCGKKDPAVLPAEGFEIGQLAPEITGKDQDGVEFKLSDYRGKVVVIDFWADW
ncbi:peroxiredoxin family protein [Planctomycetota bacterium]